MDIKEVANRAVTTLSPPKQANMSPGLQTDLQKISSRLSETAVAAQKAEQSSDDSSGENAGGLEKLRSAVEKIQEFVSSTASDIRFSIDEDSGQTVVKVIDRETQEVIRQIPSQEMLDLAQALDKLQGLLIKQKA